MLVKFKTNLGSTEATACNKECGTHINFRDCSKDAEVDLPQSAVDWLTKRHGPDQALLDVIEGVKGIAKKSEVTAPAK